MGRRQMFSIREDEKMVEYWEKMLKEKNEGAYSPCGLLLWEKFTNERQSKRSSSNLASHFRKIILNSFWEWWDVGADRVMNIFRMYNQNLDADTITRLERKFKIKIKFIDRTTRVRSWEPKVKKKAEEGEGEEKVQRNRRASEGEQTSTTNHRSKNPNAKRGSLGSRRPIQFTEDVHDDDFAAPTVPKKVKQSESPTSIALSNIDSERTLRSANKKQRIDSVESMADPDDHNYTREVRDTKKQARVRHSTREALGYPPIWTPPDGAGRNVSMDIIPDASFHEEASDQRTSDDLDPIKDEFVEITDHGDDSLGRASLDRTLDRAHFISTESNELPEGQGDDIDTVSLMRNVKSAHPNSNPAEVSDEFRARTVAAAFARLKEINEKLKDTHLTQFRLQEQTIFDEKMSMEEYLEAVAKISEGFNKNVSTLHLLGSQVNIQLRKRPNGAVDNQQRQNVVIDMLKNLCSKLSPRYFEIVSEMVEEKEAYIYFKVKDNEEYELEMKKLSNSIWEKIRADY